MTSKSPDMVRFSDVSYAYKSGNLSIPAIQQLSLNIGRSKHVAIIGHNGSGKSTFARLCNALLLPDLGKIFIRDFTADSMDDVYEIRRTCGMVFQNPDDQIVASSLEEDVAFGPENLGLPTAEIQARVQAALELVGLSAYARKSPQDLSGGQKQKLSVAGVLAMHPACLILDEATSMLDPQAAQELMDFVTKLCHEEGLTLINITHNMEEASLADEIFVLSQGRLVLAGSPQEVFAQAERLERENLILPFYLGLYQNLVAHVPDLPYPESREDLVSELAARLTPLEPDQVQALSGSVTHLAPVAPAAEATPAGSTHANATHANATHANATHAKATHAKATHAKATKAKATNAEFTHAGEVPAESKQAGQAETLIEVKDLSYTYNVKSSLAQQVLHQVNLEVKKGEILVLCGHSGSGKSTLISHFNGIYKAQEGWVKVLGYDSRDKKDLVKIRQLVGLVFQYPEKQLFAETVAEDIAFGPRQQGLTEAAIEDRVAEAAELMHIEPELLTRSPFELSGGQQRRVAIAGVLAMQPEVLVLDEPAAGLDPLARQTMLDEIKALNQQGVTIVMVTHNMEDAAYLADRIAVMAQGRILAVDEPRAIFAQPELLAKSGLALPACLAFSRELSKALQLDLNFLSLDQASSSLVAALRTNYEGQRGVV